MVEIFKTDLIKTPIIHRVGSATCPVCGVRSNTFPDYTEGEGTTVFHYLSYCGHRLETDTCIMLLGKTVKLGANP